MCVCFEVLEGLGGSGKDEDDDDDGFVSLHLYHTRYVQLNLFKHCEVCGHACPE